ncbi:hypothetical protein ANN_05706 [Periplaneta americana]|uniref:Uncharacterized protein n=1 Tax=Periplaneta americana TaxID=6978 RepID=A0ABQ8TBN5_PERAM|nr:hypothetical protein ANN_05706 [Periplaneta americana]
MSPGSSTESYPAFAHSGLRKNPGKNLNQVTCPDRESNPGHLVSRSDALTNKCTSGGGESEGGGGGESECGGGGGGGETIMRLHIVE